MAKDRIYFYLGHSLLDLGIIGFVIDNNYLALITLSVSFICFLVAAGVVRIANDDQREQTTINNYFRRTSFMTKESKILLATVVVCTLLLAGLQLFLNRQAIGITLGSAKVVKQAVEATPSASPTVIPTASASASGKAKATATIKATVKPVETPEAPTEEQPAQ
jgi:hypothetical protein